ncbi:CG42633, partial [Drosophila busckii]
RAKSSWKRMKELAAEKEKENESKRPPWRAVSVSTLPKPDKNALLRAKLLDASRRLRAGKSNVAIQTDFVPTKLMKEASIGAQIDLILFKDVGILTDGQYSKRKDGVQQYVLNYSVSQMTDVVDTAHACTQTLLPKVYADNLIRSYLANDNDAKYDMESNVRDQANRLRLLSSNEESLELKPALNLKPTLASWNFDDDVIEMDEKQNFIPYIIESFKPWKSFTPFPFRLQGNKLIGRQQIDWYALLQSIDDLIQESNNLVDKLERVTAQNKLYHNRVLSNLNEIRAFEPTKLALPSEHWLPIIEEQEKQLQQLLDG